MLTFFSILALLEWRHRRFLGKEVSEVLDILPKRTMTKDQFDQLVAEGNPLVILNDRVLDVSTYNNLHPGGNFVINMLIGRNITKFFEGEIMPADGIEAYKHSNYAWAVVN